MIDGISGSVGGVGGVGGIGAGKPASGVSSTSFSDTLKKSIEEVSKMQQDANKAVEDLATKRTDDVAGVLTAVEKSELAFKTLLAIRAKLMDAYEELKQMQV